LDFCRKGLLLIAVILINLILSISSANANSYAVTETESGWTTGLRQSQTALVDITGSSFGNGTFSRFTDMDFNDVRMKERIGALNGTLGTSESVQLQANADNDIEVNLIKLPGSQDFTITVNETWPVAMSARRSLDYSGKNIFACDLFGNNQDLVGTTYQNTRELSMARASYLRLNDTWFVGVINDTTDAILVNRFLPDKLTAYRLISRSTGEADFKYRQAMDHAISNEGEETFLGTFGISRYVLMTNPGYNGTLYEDLDERHERCWLGCLDVPSYFEPYRN